MTHQRYAKLVWGVLLLVFTSPPNVLLAQPRTSSSRDRSLERAGQQLRAAYKHVVSATFFDTLTVCASSRSPRTACDAGRASERAARETVRAGLARGFGALPPAATFARVLRIRAENAREARQSGGKSGECGGPLDRPIATIFTVTGMTVTDSVTVTTVIAHDFTSLGGCPSGLTVFSVTEIVRASGTPETIVKATQHFASFPEGPPARQP